MPQGGGGQIFQLDPNLYGGYGLGQSFGQIGEYLRGFAGRTRQEREEELQKKLRQLQLAGEVFGRGSPQYAALAQQLTGERNAQPLVPVSEQQTRKLAEAQARIAAGTGTPDDQTLVNMSLFGGALGLEGARTTAQNQRDIGQLQVEGARREAGDDATRRQELQKQGYTPGSLAANLDINRVVASEEEISNSRARTALTREQVQTERAQQQVLRAQANRYYAEARAAVAESGSAFGKQDASYLAGLRVRLEQAGIALPNTQFLAQGLAGQLPREQQNQFNTAYGAYVTEQRQKWESDVSRAASANPNTPQARAARNLSQYYEAVRRGASIRGVTEDQVQQWRATVMGATVSREEGWFKTRYVLNWRPDGGEAAGTGPATRTQTTRPATRFDPVEATSTIRSLLQAQGGDVEKAREVLSRQRATLNARNPGSGDALWTTFETLHPKERRATRPVAPPRNVATPR
jgi:hypothetical protein